MAVCPSWRPCTIAERSDGVGNSSKGNGCEVSLSEFQMAVINRHSSGADGIDSSAADSVDFTG